MEAVQQQLPLTDTTLWTHICCNYNIAIHFRATEDRLACQCSPQLCCKADVTPCCISHRHHCSTILKTSLSLSSSLYLSGPHQIMLHSYLLSTRQLNSLTIFPVTFRVSLLPLCGGVVHHLSLRLLSSTSPASSHRPPPPHLLSLLPVRCRLYPRTVDLAARPSLSAFCAFVTL